jgi:PTS system nitrogen regulatory IIA component
VRLTIRDAARYLDVSEDTVYRWIRDGEIPFTRVNDQYRLSSDDLLEWATARGINVAVDILQHAREAEVAPSFVDALRSGGVHRYNGAADRSSILAALVKQAPIVDETDQPLLMDLLVAREGIGSTGIGEGIAIPHARAPIVLHGTAASIALWYLEQPLDAGAQDRIAVDTIFFMVTPTPRIHLQLLSKLASALHDRQFRAAVKERAPLERILEEAQRIESTFLRREGTGSG